MIVASVEECDPGYPDKVECWFKRRIETAEGSQVGGWIDVVACADVVLNVGGRKQLPGRIGSPSAHASI